MKHIAPYLPYNVQIEVTDTCMDAETFETYEETYITTLDTRKLDYFKEDMKLILRPLSDLTKEIEHNGENFVPTVWLRDNHVQFGITIEDMKTLISMFIYTFKSPLSAPYYFIDKLLEWNFDIFRLIESGQAIDINTLNK